MAYLNTRANALKPISKQPNQFTIRALPLDQYWGKSDAYSLSEGCERNTPRIPVKQIAPSPSPHVIRPQPMPTGEPYRVE